MAANLAPAPAVPDSQPLRRPRLVVVGNGVAAMRTLEELLALAPEQYDITVFGAEAHPGAYNRILLSPLLAGEKTRDDLVTHDSDWFEQRGIRFHAGDAVVCIDRRRRLVYSQLGHTVAYERLLIATGSRPTMLPVPGAELPGVLGFRNFEDIDRMLAAAETRRHAVVIGGGLLGIEAADALVKRGMDVTLLHRSTVLMNQQLDEEASTLLQQSLQGRGLKLKLDAETAAIVGPDRVQAVCLKDGSRLPADLVVMAVGVRPDLELARRAGLHCERGIVVDDTLQTYDPRVYAVGECVQHRGSTFGLVTPLLEQARVCAAHLASLGHRRYANRPAATRLKVSGIDLFSAGDFTQPGCETLVLRDSARSRYKRLLLRDGRIAAIVLFGDVRDGHWYFEMMQSGQDVSPFRDRLLFGRSYCESQPA